MIDPIGKKETVHEEIVGHSPCIIRCLVIADLKRMPGNLIRQIENLFLPSLG